jgi:diacylglycerol kinase
MSPSHFIKRFYFALYGIYSALRYDRSFQIQTFIGIPAAIVIGYFGRPLSELDLFLLILATALVLITELQNSAFETALDKLHPAQHTAIKHGKDMAAGAVLVAALFAALVAGKVLFF